MKIFYTPHFQRSFRGFSKVVKIKFAKQIDYLLININHPSLRAKKYSETEGVWQARVDDNVRFYFLMRGDNYILLDIKRHPK
ncbi:MAG: hypothetical protein PHU56_01275 [Candidatus Pacebacteria bacterium]|nr:hypothetical protein [Candidatus Paceibacterota bacterium]